MDNSTIAAIATPVGRGGIGIIKLSGSKALSIAAALFSPAGSEAAAHPEASRSSKANTGDDFKSQRLYYGHIIEPGSRRIIDEVLLAVMKAPRSYTREDIVEINAHGGQVAVNAILELVLRHGARIAEPGEFTKRAFLNGRIDLTQAEAVIDIINARTDKALQMAAAQVNGQLKRSVERIREFLIELLTRTEAGIDFPDDVPEIIDPKATRQEIERHVINPLRRLIQQHVDGNVLRDGLKVAVVGRPNVGKSSLLNCLVKKERAIVTATPGTTRDSIEETLSIKGIPIVLVDTAGLHDTDDPIETIGIQKTIENINGADLVLFMVEAHCSLTAADHKIFEQLGDKPRIVVLNKIDLVGAGNCIDLPDSWKPNDSVQISALYDHGIGPLKNLIFETGFGKKPIDLQEGIIPNLRQKLLLEDSVRAAEAAGRQFDDGIPVELVAIDLQEAIDALGQVIGSSVKVDLLDQIFSRFCIGK
jgi:tRNA modification GTPase